MPKTKKAKNPNENCLMGFQCPECKSYGPFHILVTTMVLMSDEGTEESGGDQEWDKDSYCACANCDHNGTVRDFINEED
jgi:hypothetical protein